MVAILFAIDSPTNKGGTPVLNLINRLASDVQLMFRRPARTQYAALCYRFRKKRTILEILLITSRDTGRWVIPKGWPMPGRLSPGVAEREAFEEAGVKGKASAEPLGSYMYQKGMADGYKVNSRFRCTRWKWMKSASSFPKRASGSANGSVARKPPGGSTSPASRNSFSPSGGP